MLTLILLLKTGLHFWHCRYIRTKSTNCGTDKVQFHTNVGLMYTYNFPQYKLSLTNLVVIAVLLIRICIKFYRFSFFVKKEIMKLCMKDLLEKGIWFGESISRNTHEG